jgi:heptosyltransferase-3
LKILIIKRDKLGDLLLTTPLLAHLRAAAPQAQIHLLANDYNAWVVADEPAIDRCWIYRRMRNGRRVDLSAAWGLLVQNRRLRAEAFDAAIVANGSPSPRAIERGLSAGARRVVAYVDDVRHYPRLTDPLPEAKGVHEVERLLALAQPLGISPPQVSPYPRYRLPDPVGAEARTWLTTRGLAPGRYVVLGLGARRAKKQPSTQQVLAWAQRLKSEFALDTVFMWTPGRGDDPRYPGDDAVAQPVLDAGVSHIHPFRGPVLPALGLIWHARTSLFPDSGLMHFAAASPGGVLGLFAETSVSPPPSQWAPRGPRAGYLEAALSVTELSDEEVFAAFGPKLAGP